MDPMETEFDYEILGEELTFVEVLANILKKCFEVSNIDCRYFPFRMHLGKTNYESTDDLLQEFVQALGYEAREDSGISEDGDHFSLLEVDKNSNFIFTQFDEDEEEEIEEYLNKSQIAAHKKANEFMKQRFKNIYRFKIASESYHHACDTYPVFIFGITPQGSALGTFTVRADRS